MSDAVTIEHLILEFVPQGADYRWEIYYGPDELSLCLYQRDVEVAGCVSSPPDWDAFTSGVRGVLRARFDPTYDACEVPRG